MLYCNLMGGLGNMLFQMSASYSFSREANTELCFPNFEDHINYLNQETKFNPSMKHAQDYVPIVSKFPFKTKLYSYPKNVLRYPFEYTPMLPSDGDMVVGYFQSEKYFHKYREEILSFLKPSSDLCERIKQEKDSLPLKYNALHVRLGDYMKNPSYHTNIPFSYYLNAIKQIDSDLPWLVFSDSIDICKEYFTGDRFLFSENRKDYIEMYLMADAENFIMSNSSFSWWAAWIGEKGMKNIVSPDPSRWFGSDPNARSINTRDIIPDRWRKVSL